MEWIWLWLIRLWEWLFGRHWVPLENVEIETTMVYPSEECIIVNQTDFETFCKVEEEIVDSMTEELKDKVVVPEFTLLNIVDTDKDNNDGVSNQDEGSHVSGDLNYIDEYIQWLDSVPQPSAPTTPHQPKKISRIPRLVTTPLSPKSSHSFVNPPEPQSIASPRASTLKEGNQSMECIKVSTQPISFHLPRTKTSNRRPHFIPATRRQTYFSRVTPSL